MDRENIGGKIINEMLEELLGNKARLGQQLLEGGGVFSVTLSHLRKYDGWDIRLSIGPNGAFDETEEAASDHKTHQRPENHAEPTVSEEF